ncbi:non-structural transmembrane protein [Porcine ephemerovirus 2]|uniref:Non-structural transmembrane protein n=1 Tax=Porcine ephemerovirus 2 TaxID=2928257 RepID=A0AAX3A6L1_9RHAB|nr:non-structural transmembrane protein [Porcine ephemerovirus 2]UNP42121.1 non-structural transmembrane protein [Porcine ephemerovirus 2]
MTLLILNILIFIVPGSVFSQWVNLPLNCKKTEDHDSNYDICDPSEYRYKLFDEDLDKIGWLNLGKICTPDPYKSRIIKAKLCQQVNMTTECKSENEGIYQIRQLKSVKDLSKYECILNRDKFHDHKVLPPYFPPPYCESFKNHNNTLSFYQFLEVDAEEDPRHKSDDILFNNNYKIKDLMVSTGMENGYNWHSDYCKVSNWNCFGGKLNMTADLKKGVSWEDLQYLLLKWGVIYEEPGIFEPIKKGACRTSYCGKEVIRLPDNVIIRVEDPSKLPHLSECSPLAHNWILHRRKREEFSTEGIQLLIKTRESICARIRRRLLEGKFINWLNVEKLSPLLPGKGYGYNFEKYKSFYGPITQLREVHVKGLVRYKCDFIPSLIKQENSKAYYKPIGGSRWLSYDLNVTTQEDVGKWDFSDQGRQGVTEYSINGIFRRNGVITFPWSRFLNILMDDINGKKLDFKKWVLKHNIEVLNSYRLNNITNETTFYEYESEPTEASTIETSTNHIDIITYKAATIKPTIRIGRPSRGDYALYIYMLFVTVMLMTVISIYCCWA